MPKKMMLCLLAAFAAPSIAPQALGPPRAVVFDFGGVMTGESRRESVVEFLSATFGFTSEEFQQVNREKRQALQEGKTDVEFWLQYAQEHGVSLATEWVEDFNSVLRDAIGVLPEMYALVDQLKAKNVTVALLSNIDARLASLLRGFGFYEPFAPCLLSCELGVEKPDLRIYEILLEKMSLPAQDILFIDDKSENVEAARELGIDALLFTNQEALQEELAIRNLI